MKSPLYIPKSERGLIVGATGSGKSYLAERLLFNKQNLIVIDPKGQFNIKGRTAVIARRPKDILKWKARGNEYLDYVPFPENDTKQYWDEVFKSLFYRRIKPFIYIDELTMCINGPLSYPPYLKAIYAQGRSLGIGCLACSQRPKGIPLFTRSEVERMWQFRLNVRSDLLTMAEVMGDTVFYHPVNGHNFWFKTIYEEYPARYIIKEN